MVVSLLMKTVSLADISILCPPSSRAAVNMSHTPPPSSSAERAPSISTPVAQIQPISSVLRASQDRNVPPPPIALTPQQRQEHLDYLKECRICERLEAMVKHVLHNRPEDPMMAMCNALRVGGPASSAVLGLLPGGSSGGHLTGSPSAMADRRGVNGSLRASRPGSLDRRGESQTEEPRHATPQRTSGSANHIMYQQPTSRSLLGDDAFVAPVPTGAEHPMTDGQTTSARDNADEGFAASATAAVDEASLPAPMQSATSHIIGGRPARADGAGNRAVSATSSTQSQTHAVAGGTKALGIERDESTKSDISGFSVSSMDMSEFLTEFRAAHFAVFQGSADGEFLSLSNLGDIVDRVSLPLPDLRLLRDLFNELDVHRKDRVPFEAFLARMNYKIQGRYHADIIRALFNKLLGSTTNTLPAASAAAPAATTDRYTVAQRPPSGQVGLRAEPAHSPAAVPAVTQRTSLYVTAPGAAAGMSHSTDTLADLVDDDIAMAQDCGAALALASGASAAPSGPSLRTHVAQQLPPHRGSSFSSRSQLSNASGGPPQGPAAGLPQPTNGSPSAGTITRGVCFEGVVSGLGLTVTPKQFDDVLLKLGLIASTSSMTASHSGGLSSAAGPTAPSQSVAVNMATDYSVGATAADGAVSAAHHTSLLAASASAPGGAQCALHLLDFARVVSAVTAVCSGHTAASFAAGGGVLA